MPLIKLDPNKLRGVFMDDSSRLNSDGYQLYLQNKYEEALRKYDSALKLKNDFPEALYNRGLVYQQLGDDRALHDFFRALRIFKTLSEKDPKNFRLKNYLGLAHFRLDHYDKAIDILSEIIKIDRKSSDALKSRGLVYLSCGKYKEAQRDFDEAIQFNEKDIETFYNLGFSHYSTKKYEEAIKNFEAVLKINPNDVYAFANKGIILHASGLKNKMSGNDSIAKENFEEAKGNFKKALQLDPKCTLAHNRLGRLYLTQRKFNEAAKEFEKAIGINNKDIFAHNNLGLIHYRQNRFKEALIEFNKVVEVDSENNFALHFISKIHETQRRDESLKTKGKLLYHKKKYREAILEFSEIKEDSQEYANALKGIGNCYYRLKEYQKALNAYNEALRINPYYTDIYYNCGIVFNAKGEYAKSIESYQKVIELNPKYYLAYNNRGYAFYKIGRYKEALEDFNKCLEISKNEIKKDYYNALSNKGIVLLRLGYYKEARKILSRTVEIYPSFDEAWYHKGLVHFSLEEFDKAEEAFDQVIELDKDFVVDSWVRKGLIFAELNNHNEAMKAFSKGEEIIIKHKNKDLKEYETEIWKIFYSDNENISKDFEKDVKVYLKDLKSYLLKICENTINKDIEKYIKEYAESRENDTLGSTFSLLHQKYRVFSLFRKGFELHYEKIKNRYKKYSIDLLLSKSFALYLLGKYEEALVLIEEIPAEDKARIPALKQKGVIMEKQRKNKEVKDNYCEILNTVNRMKIDEWDIQPYNDMFFVLRKQGEYEKCIELYKEACSKNLVDSYLMYQLGIVLRYHNNLYRALDAFKKAIELNPNYYEAWINKALVLRGLLEHEKSKDSFNQAEKILNSIIKLNENHSAANYHMGLIHYDRQNYKEAIAFFNKAMQSRDYYEDAGINKGLSLFSLKRYDEAIDVFDQIRDKKNVSEEAKFDALNDKGIVLLCQNEEILAQEAFLKAAEIDKPAKDSNIWKKIYRKLRNDKGQSADFKNNMGLLSYYKEKNKTSLKLFNEAIKIESGQPIAEKAQLMANVFNNKGLLLFKMGRFEESIESFDKSIDIAPEYSFARKSKALVLCELGEYEKALTVFEEAQTIRPTEGKVNLLLANTRLKLGDVRKANESIEEALKDFRMLLDEKSKIYSIRGQIEIGKRNYSEAIESFEKAISFDPSNLSFLIWKAYVRYLKAEYLINRFQSQDQKEELSQIKDSERTNSINKEYQEEIVAIIRDLEKVYISFNKKQKSLSLSQIISLETQALGNKLEKVERFIYGESKLIKPSTCLKCHINLLTMPLELKKIVEDRLIEAYTYYSIGYLYYKINDFYSALNKLKKCTDLKPGSNINEPAKSMIQNIWNYKIKPPWWKWWLCSPINKWSRRIFFGVIVFSIFGVLLPSFTRNLVFSLTHFLSGSLESLAFELRSLAYILTDSIAAVQEIVLLILLFVLLSPSIEHIRSKDFELKLSSSPAPFIEFCPLIPDFTPEKSTTLRQIKKRPKSLEIHEIRDKFKEQTNVK